MSVHVQKICKLAWATPCSSGLLCEVPASSDEPAQIKQQDQRVTCVASGQSPHSVGTETLVVPLPPAPWMQRVMAPNPANIWWVMTPLGTLGSKVLALACPGA